MKLTSSEPEHPSRKYLEGKYVPFALFVYVDSERKGKQRYHL